MSSNSTTGAVRVTAYGRSDRGKVRSANQDSLLLASLDRGEPEALETESDETLAVGPVQFELEGAGAILMVADGMGGRAGGERASAAAIAAVGTAMAQVGNDPAPSVFAEALDQALAAANATIHAEGTSDERYRGMGTTATLAGLLGNTVFVAQVGDSRAYLVRNGSMARLTRDQSLVQDLIDMGVLSEEDAQNVPKNQILQAVGVAPTVQPVMTYHELRRGDVLVLCSDGLSGVVTDDEVLHEITRASDCEAACRELVGLANQRGGPDNITVLAARLDGEALSEADERDVVRPRSYTPGTP